MKRTVLFAAMLLSLACLRAQAPTTPYSTGFEPGDDRAWTLANGHSAWTIGTAAAAEGQYSLYITADSGATNDYAVKASCSWAWRPLQLAAGEYSISFDWRAEGEYNYDYMRVFLIPDSNRLAADSIPGNISARQFVNNQPPDWINLVSATITNLMNWTELALRADWQHYNYGFSLDEAGMYKLCFVWVNDSTVHHAPAAAVDNVELHKVCAPVPTALTLDSTTTNALTLSWNGGGANLFSVSLDGSEVLRTVDTFCTVGGLLSGAAYRVEVRSVCPDGELSEAAWMLAGTLCDAPIHIPYSEDFSHLQNPDNLMNNLPTMPCWEQVGIPRIYDWDSEGNRYLAFAQYNSYVVLQEVDTVLNVLEVSLRARVLNSGGSSDLIVGVAQDSNRSMFDTVAVIDLDDQVWRNYTISLGAYAGTGTRIVLGSSRWTAIDDLTIDFIGACAHPYNLTIDSVTNRTASINWENSDSTLNYLVEYRPADSSLSAFLSLLSTNTSATLTGLAGNTRYLLRVSAICADSTMLRAIEAEFTTECDPYALPLTEDFDGDGVLPTCWSGKYDDPAFRTRVPHIEREDNGNGVLYLQHAGLVKLPEVDEELHLLQMEFDLRDAYLSHLGGNLIVGVVEDTGFAGIDTFGVAGHYITYFADYAGSSRTIGLRVDEDFTYFLVDNLTVDYEAPCRPVTALRVVDARDGSLTIDWTDAAMNAQSWQLNINEGTELLTNNPLITITSHPFTITGLDANTYYTFTVRPVCSSPADWVLPISAQTECEMQTITAAAPLTEDFESGAPCWQVANGVTLFAADSADHAYLHHINIIWRQGYHFFSPRFESNDPLTVKFIFSAMERYNRDRELYVGCANAKNVDSIVWLDTINDIMDWNPTWMPAGYRLPAGMHYVVFRAKNDVTIYIDNVEIGVDDGSLDVCTPVTILSAVEDENDHVVFTWTSAGTAYQYHAAWGAWDYADDGIPTNDTTCNVLTYFHPDDTLYFGVRRLCPDGSFGDWTLNHMRVSQAVGIENVEGSMSGIKIYPNPATTTVTIAIAEGESPVEISIVDVSGRTVHRTTDSSTTIDVSHFARGAYFVRVATDEGVSVRKLVLN